MSKDKGLRSKGERSSRRAVGFLLSPFSQARSVSRPGNASTSTSGFTLVELLVVMALIGILTSLTVMNLVQPQRSASLNGTVDVLVADIKSQQLKAMAGDAQSASAAQQHGVYVEPTKYTLFKGTTYSAGDGDNFVVQPDGVTFSTTFASSQLSFQKASGEPASFSGSTNTLTVSNLAGESKTITVNRYGVVTVN
jgi:prepilin-type N-terminal cleavage/methylation domain-containing protein